MSLVSDLEATVLTDKKSSNHTVLLVCCFLTMLSASISGCKEFSVTSTIATTPNLPEDDFKLEHCKNNKKVLSKRTVLKAGTVQVLTSTQDICPRKGLTLTEAPKEENLAILIVNPGTNGSAKTVAAKQQMMNRMSQTNKDNARKYRQGNWQTLEIDLANAPEAKTRDQQIAYIRSEIKKRYPNGYSGNLDIMYDAHGYDPEYVAENSDNTVESGEHFTVGRSTETSNGQTAAPSREEIGTTHILSEAEEAIRGDQQTRGQTVGVVNSCYSGQTLKHVECSNSEQARNVRNNFDEVVTSGRSDIPSNSSSNFDSDWAEMRGGNASEYDSNGDGRVTSREFADAKSGVQSVTQLAVGVTGVPGQFIFEGAKEGEVARQTMFNQRVGTMNGDVELATVSDSGSTSPANTSTRRTQEGEDPVGELPGRIHAVDNNGPAPVQQPDEPTGYTETSPGQYTPLPQEYDISDDF